MEITKIIKEKTRKTLPYYIFALLVTIMILILWQTFREKRNFSKSISPQQPTINVSGPKTDPNQKVFFASNGKDTAYKIKKGDKWSVLFNGVESKEYDYVSGAVFSSDGEQFAFSAENGGQAYVVVNNIQEIIAYKKVGYIVFNSSGTTIAFVATKDSGEYVVISTSVAPTNSEPQTITGDETQSFDQIGSAVDENGNLVSIIFSEDGDEFAYIVETDEGVYIVIDGEESEVYDSISDITLDEDGNLSYSAQDDGQTIIVVDDTIVSTGETDDSTSTEENESETSETTSSTPTNSSTTNSSTFKPITNIDIDRSSDGEIETEASCTAGQNCNF